MSDNVTGYGVPLTTAQRVAKYGARTRPHVEGKLPQFELDTALDATYRETILIGYEVLDAKAKKVLSDARSWVWLQALGGAAVIVLAVLALAGAVTPAVGIGWAAVAAAVIVVGFPYRRHELRRHEALVGEAEQMLAPFIEAGTAHRI